MRTGTSSANSWVGRDWQGTTLRVAIAVAPTVFATVAVFLLLRLTTAPTELTPAIARILAVVLVGFVIANVVNRMANRLLPLAALLKLSLAFPDQAPSRFKVAMRASSSRALARQIETAREQGLSENQTEAAEQILLLTTAVGEHDRLTRGHSERVRVYARMVGEQMGIEGDELEKLQWGAILHDIGKLSVPPELLNKPGAPTDEEWKVISKHPSAGGQLISPVAGFLGMWALAAESHHEKFDGSGYPLGLAGSEIPLAGRIVSVADAFEVMTATRSYKKPMSAEAAREELTRGAGTHFDPDVVRAFLTISTGNLRRAGGGFGWLFSIPVLGPLVSNGSRVIGQIQAIPSAIAGTAPASAVSAGAMAVATVSGAITLPPPPELAAVAISRPGIPTEETAIPQPELTTTIVEPELTTTELASSPDTERPLPTSPTTSPTTTTAPTTTAPTTAAPTTTTSAAPTTTTTTAPTTTAAPSTTAPATTTQPSVTNPPTTTAPPPPDEPYTVALGDVVEVPADGSADLSPTGPFRDDATMWFLNEGQTTTDQAIRVGRTVIQPGATVCSYYFVLAPTPGQQQVANDFSLTFTEPVVALAVTDIDLDRSDIFTIEGTTFDVDRALEFGQPLTSPGADQGSFADNVLELQLQTNPGYADAVRVITECEQ